MDATPKSCCTTTSTFLSRDDAVSLPPVTAWILDDQSKEWVPASTDFTDVSAMVVQSTYAWCHDFVLQLQLCPWAKASIETPSALQIFVIDPKDPLPANVVSPTEVIESLARRFQDFLEETTNLPNQPSNLESAAIFFVVFAERNGSTTSSRNSSNDTSTTSPMARTGLDFLDFLDFYDWFVELEDDWSQEDVIVAPFHPQWSFATGDEDENDNLQNLDFEKRSPYPTVSLVASRVVEAAGEEVTAKIGTHNEQVLLEADPAELSKLWHQCCNKSTNE